jgi:hypothetical protein
MGRGNVGPILFRRVYAFFKGHVDVMEKSRNRRLAHVQFRGGRRPRILHLGTGEGLMFEGDQRVKGVKLVEFIRWARESFEWKDGHPPPTNGVLALPPIQRNAAWGPRQVVDVWDSVLRGLPLGTFMLQLRKPGQWGLRMGADARKESLPPGWDLLDGQQRLRSLLLGV